MITPSLTEARRAVIQIESQFALPPAALAALTTISEYLESVPAAQIANEIELAKLRTELATYRVQTPTAKLLQAPAPYDVRVTIPSQQDLMSVPA